MELAVTASSVAGQDRPRETSGERDGRSEGDEGLYAPPSSILAIEDGGSDDLGLAASAVFARSLLADAFCFAAGYAFYKCSFMSQSSQADVQSGSIDLSRSRSILHASWKAGQWHGEELVLESEG